MIVFNIVSWNCQKTRCEYSQQHRSIKRESKATTTTTRTVHTTVDTHTVTRVTEHYAIRLFVNSNCHPNQRLQREYNYNNTFMLFWLVCVCMRERLAGTVFSPFSQPSTFTVNATEIESNQNIQHFVVSVFVFLLFQRLLPWKVVYLNTLLFFRQIFEIFIFSGK